MRTSFLQITTGLLLICCVPAAMAQRGGGPEFYNCSNSPISLCVNDPGVRLPDDNQFYLGEGDPNASSCSVHFTQQVQIHSTCSNTFQYKLEVSYFDTSAYVEILSWTQGETDEHDEAILSFDTENSTNPEVSAHGLPYTLDCSRYHRLRWTVMDTCGNSTSCDKRIDLYDCHAPIPLASQGMHVLDFHGSYQLIANLNDFAGSYLDDCASSSQFLFSIRNNAYITDTLFEYCDVPAFGVLVFIPFWVADEGRDLNCNGSISWDERNKYSVSAPVVFTSNGTQDCSDTTLYIYGSIKTVLGEGIAKTHMTATDAEQSYPEVITNDTGYYAFPHYDFTYPVTVTPVRHDGFRNGVNTLDLVKIQKHLLGIDRFTQPYQFIAADANHSAGISAIDLVVLRKLILGLTDTLPGNKSWRFFDTLPGGAGNNVIASESEQDHKDFIGVKIGDVN
ncbi:MAG TPA: hypothetical protein VJ508_02020, partial [Saprospiraceae bacterium]|nr:hypothetical protein [Saprospiraceae bacterium]